MENIPEYLENARARLGAFNQLIGLEVDEAGEGFCRGSCPIEEKLLNPRGSVHGGELATVLDTTAGLAAIMSSPAQRSVVTQSADIHYLRPVTGGRMFCRAETVKAGRHTGLVQAEIRTEDGTLAVTASFEIFFVD